MTITRSRFCKPCNATYRYECSCPNNKAMAWQRANIFHSGKRYKGKTAWEKVFLEELEYKKKEL